MVNVVCSPIWELVYGILCSASSILDPYRYAMGIRGQFIAPAAQYCPDDLAVYSGSISDPSYFGFIIKLQLPGFAF